MKNNKNLSASLAVINLKLKKKTEHCLKQIINYCTGEDTEKTHLYKRGELVIKLENNHRHIKKNILLQSDNIIVTYNYYEVKKHGWLATLMHVVSEAW